MNTTSGWKLVPVTAMTPQMLLAVQKNTEIGMHITATWAGAYDCLNELWRVAVEAAPVPPEQTGDAADYVLMPSTLTAENGAKAALIGEFHVTILDGCPDCFEDSADEANECQTCNGTGLVDRKLPIDWPTIKTIYAAAVAACALEQKP